MCQQLVGFGMVLVTKSEKNEKEEVKFMMLGN
jgi:hypothetical protein